MGAVATLFVAGCSGSSSRVSTGSATTTGLPGVTTSTTPTTSAPLVGASTTPVSTPIQGHAKLVAIRVGDQGGFDRVTFEFRDGLPGFHVRYISRPVQEDASGKTIEVAGDSVLAVSLAGASGVDLNGGKVTETYTGPKRFTVTTPSVVELVERGDFEDVLNWAIGTHGKPAFKVSPDAAGLRLVVDIAH